MVTYWLISSNDSIFRLEDCLNESQYVDWQSSFSPKVGDVVFIYRTKPTQRVCYMMEVVAINIPYRKTINDIKYWGEKHSPKGETNPDEPIDGGGSYRLCVVTNAIQQPVLTVFIWDSILRAWVSDKDQSLVLSIEERPSYLAEVE